VNAGMQVTALAVVGHVTASAPAEARQPGRVGEVIRITNRATGTALRARVLDARTVEVVP
jgi:flagella basal body P-ring formation protein FlgA